MPSNLVSQILAAFTSLETTGTATIGPIDVTESVTVFGQHITATESVTVTLKKV